jgi:hypothetical protein
MKDCITVAILCAGIAMGFGCASNEWQADQVPLPQSTPYDANQMARTAYLEGFRQGYTAQRNQSGGVEFVTGPYRDAKQQGFRAGAAEARARQTGDVPPASQIHIAN